MNHWQKGVFFSIKTFSGGLGGSLACFFTAQLCHSLLTADAVVIIALVMTIQTPEDNKAADW